VTAHVIKPLLHEFPILLLTH